jgi:RNA polymerase sigma factor (sigma-70 family)
LAANNELAAWVHAVAQERDREAFARLFDHFAPRLEAWLIRAGADSGTAEEVTQDVMVTLWRKAALFDPTKSSVTTWLYRIARNRRIDLLRRNKVDFVDPLETVYEPSETPDFDAALDLQDREDRVRHALKSLPDEQLALVRLAFFDGLSHSDIAQKTGLPLGTVKSRIRLAFTRLRRNLETVGVVEAG